MFGTQSIYTIVTVVYLLALIGMVAYLRRYDDPTQTRVGYVVVGVVVVSLFGALAESQGFLTYSVSTLDVDQSIPRFIDDTIAYGTLFGLTTWFAGASRRMIALVAGLSALSRIAIEVGAYISRATVVLALLISIGSFLFRVYLLWRPVARTASRQPVERNLLFWKARNQLMFLIGMAIVSAFLTPAGLVDQTVQNVLLAYTDFLIRVGFVGFLLANLTALDTEGA